MTAHSAVSTRAPLLGSTMATRRSACDGDAASEGAAPSRGATIATASAPLTRMIPIALSPIAVATATIVSSARGRSGPAGVLGLARRAGARRSVHELLLHDLEHVGYGPVQDQARREVQEHKGENDWHEQHHLRLSRITHSWCQLLLDEHRDAHEDRQDVGRIVRRQVADPEIDSEEPPEAQKRR